MPLSPQRVLVILPRPSRIVSFIFTLTVSFYNFFPFNVAVFSLYFMSNSTNSIIFFSSNHHDQCLNNHAATNSSFNTSVGVKSVYNFNLTWVWTFIFLFHFWNPKAFDFVSKDNMLEARTSNPLITILLEKLKVLEMFVAIFSSAVKLYQNVLLLLKVKILESKYNTFYKQLTVTSWDVIFLFCYF